MAQTTNPPLMFNTAGPCVSGEHYMLCPEERFQRVMELVAQKRFFTLQAGRQTGKTTSLRWLVRRYNEGACYAALFVDVQTAREQPDVAVAVRIILDEIEMAVQRDLVDLEVPDARAFLDNPATAVLRYLHAIAARVPRPLVVMVDEADCLVGAAMVSFLTQLRRGYIDRDQTPFAHSLALVGTRPVRDYCIAADDRRALPWLGTSSPFNVSAETAMLRMFTERDVGRLLAQHTDATGQEFTADAVAHVWYLSQGHPWLVNALAAEPAHRVVLDRGVTITAADIEAAKEAIVVQRRSHIDSLHARLREPRVCRILAPMLTGDWAPDDLLDDDFSYVLGLGIVAERDGVYEIANPVYREVVPRVLTAIKQRQIRHDPAWYVRPDGGLDMSGLLAGWQTFWRKDGHLAADGFGYREAGPHLMLMAFLQRIVNGGGRIEREYGLGRGALDLLVEWPSDDGVERFAIEVKLRRNTETETEALKQVAGYLDRLALDEGWLVMFDLRATVSWEERIRSRDLEHEGKRVHLVCC